MSGGLQVIREAVAARPNVHAIMGRECAVGIDLLGTFAKGHTDIPADNLDRVVKFIWNGMVIYNRQTDSLQAVNQAPARSVGVLPKLEMALPKYQPGPNQRGGPQLDPNQPPDAPPVKSKPKPKQRPGWIGGVWE